MKGNSILLKSLICSFTYVVFVLLLFFVVYEMDFFGGAFIVGLLCGVVIALITYSDSLKISVTARCFGLLASVVSQVVLELLGVPRMLLMHIFRNDSFVRETGRLTVNETMGYGWGRFLFWGGLLLSFVVSLIGTSLFNVIKRRRK